MELLQIVLIVIGVVIVAASFVLSGKLFDSEEEKDLEAHKEELRAEMDRVFDKHAEQAQLKVDEAVNATWQAYVEEAKREIAVTVNEAKEYMEALTRQTQEKLEACVKQAQEDAGAISEENKMAMEKMAAAQQEKLQACSDSVIKEINNHHNEVTFLYSMINNKQEEIKEEAKIVAQVREEAKELAAEVELVKMQANAMTQTAGDVRETFINRIKEDIKQELSVQDEISFAEEEPAYEPTKQIDSAEIKEALHHMEQQEPEASVEEEAEVMVADVEPVEDISVKTVKAAVEEVLTAGASVEEAPKPAAQETEEPKPAAQEIEEPEPAESVDIKVQESEVAGGKEQTNDAASREDAPKAPDLAEAEAAASVAAPPKDASAPKEKKIPDDVVLEDAPNKMLKVVRESGTVSTDADVETRMKVLAMYDQGYASMDIAEELKLGIGEVRMIVDLYSRRER